MTALESAFLGLESHDVPFVYASILEFDQPIEVAALRERMTAAIAEIPRYRQRIVRRWPRRPVWVDDDDFRITRQIDTIAVPAPGGTHELEELTAHLLATELPADHAPWRIFTVTGLAGGGGALIALVHHSLVDGIRGIELLEHVLRSGPPRETAAPAPAAVRGRGSALRGLVAWRNVTALARLLRDGLRPASQVGINPRHTDRIRAVASQVVELAAVQTIEHAFVVTNNDVVLATVAGALDRFLRRRQVDVDRSRDVRAMVPAGRKGHGEAAGNEVVLLLAPLRVELRDPVERLLAISRAMRSLKRGHTASAGDLLVALGDATTPAVLTNVLRLALRQRAFNVIVTNVPGPRQPLSLFGARLTRLVPIVNLWPHQAVGIAVASYATMVAFGIQVDRSVIPEVDVLRADLADAFAELLAAARAVTTAATGEPRTLGPKEIAPS